MCVVYYYSNIYHEEKVSYWEFKNINKNIIDMDDEWNWNYIRI